MTVEYVLRVAKEVSAIYKSRQDELPEPRRTDAIFGRVISAADALVDAMESGHCDPEELLSKISAVKDDGTAPHEIYLGGRWWLEHHYNVPTDGQR